jgi:hypothetical protein
MLAQATNQNRRPIFMVADLDGQNVVFVKDPDALQQITRALFDVAECPEDFTARCKDSRGIAFSRECFLPRF